MLYFDHTFPSPAENLACDEALLDHCESGNADEALRFWESHSSFVVLGYGNKVQTEVNVPACQRDGIPILRRCSGGGAVLQGPGCLNYSLVLRMNPELECITAANCRIMKRNAAALSKLLGETVTVEGYTDLAIAGRKFSGNAQRRKRTHLLFHGTFLLDFDLSLIPRYLRAPSRQPDYRQSRDHNDFLRSVTVPRDAIKRALVAEWKASDALATLPNDAIKSLVTAKYSRPEWNRKF